MIDDYIRHGWFLTPIKAQQKTPVLKNWNSKENAMKLGDYSESVGIMHAYSGTMAFDIDNISRSHEILMNEGISIASLFLTQGNVRIDSGRPNKAKFLFRMPLNIPLVTKKVNDFSGTLFEFRCGTADNKSSQDILPPSIHPITKQPYRWHGDWRKLPVIPPKILKFWTSLTKTERVEYEKSSASDLEIEKLLSVIPPDCPREEWLRVGMALHHSSTSYFDFWDKWSSGAPEKYKGRRATFEQWQSFKSSPGVAITLASLFHIARRYGWSPAPLDISGMLPPTSTIAPPQSILLMASPHAPDIHEDHLPPVLWKRAQEISKSIGCDILVPILAGISAVCAVADARSRLELISGYEVPPVLWLMTVGAPADKKSPGSRPMLSYLAQIEAEDYPLHRQRYLMWEAQEAMYASSKKAYLEYFQNAEALLDTDGAPAVQELPDAPVPLRMTVNDITSQKLVRDAQGRPQGLLCYLDEMNAWINKVNDRHSGEDRSAWVQAYESAPYRMDRVGAGSIHCSNLAVSIYGNVQPQVLEQHLNALAADGLVQRFIPVRLRTDETKVGNPIPDFLTTRNRWESLLKGIFALDTKRYKLSEAAYSAFRAFQYWYDDQRKIEQEAEASTVFMTAFGKSEGTLGRIVFIFHLIEAPLADEVSLETMERGIRFMKEFVIPSLRHCFFHADGSPSLLEWLTKWVLQRAHLESFTMRDLQQSSSRKFRGGEFPKARPFIINVLDELQNANWLKEKMIMNEKGNSVTHYFINPGLREEYREEREKVIQERQRAQDVMAARYGLIRKPVAGNSF